MKPFIKIIAIYAAIFLTSALIVMQLSQQEDSSIESELRDIESTIEQHPETAIKRLKSIEVKNIKSKRDKTLYQLLHIFCIGIFSQSHKLIY